MRDPRLRMGDPFYWVRVQARTAWTIVLWWTIPYVLREPGSARDNAVAKRHGTTGLLEPHKVGAGRKDQPKEMLELLVAVSESIPVVDLI